MGNLFRALLNTFYSRKLEVVLVGLENSGKTTLLQVLSGGEPVQTAPTIGLNVRIVRKGGVQMKCWDLGGQSQYRSEWGRYTKGCNVIVFVVDSNAIHLLPDAKSELHRLLEDRELARTAILIVANKIDLDPHVSETDLVKGKQFQNQNFIIWRSFIIYRLFLFIFLDLNLDYIADNPWLIISCSALKTTNVNEVLEWLIKQSRA